MLKFVAAIAASVTLSSGAIAVASYQARGSAPAGVAQLQWISGCWSLARPDGMTEEHWMKPAGGTMLGMSRTVRGGRTTEHEFLQIRDVGGKLSYIAKPSGQAETTFPLLRASDTEVVFENPAHDFPQRIIYKKTADGVTARVEGTMNGQARGFDFPFKACH
jgi:hypothetical protein